MKNTRMISAFLVVLFLFSGCTFSKENSDASLPSDQSETAAVSVTAASQTTLLQACEVETTQAQTQASVPTVPDTTTATTVTSSAVSAAAASTTTLLQAGEVETAQAQTQVSVTTVPDTTATTAVTSSAAAATTCISVSDTEGTLAQTETTVKSILSLFTKPTKAEAETTESEHTEKSKNKNTCTVTITCTTISRNRSMLKKGKERFVPKSGVILESAEVEFTDGETAFDVIRRACLENVCTDNCKYCQKNGIQLEYNYTPAFGTYYIEGIHQLYEKDCGSMSGWMFSVNGSFPTEGSSSYTVKPGDKMVFAYTCDMGDDIGNAY